MVSEAEEMVAVCVRLEGTLHNFVQLELFTSDLHAVGKCNYFSAKFLE